MGFGGRKMTIRGDFWDKVMELDKFFKRLKEGSRHIGGIKFEKKFEKSYEKFKKIILEIDELLAVYCDKEEKSG